MADTDEANWLAQRLPAVRATERLIVDAVCHRIENDSYIVFRSDRFPNFYGGNGIMIRRGANPLPVSGWVEIFHNHFDSRKYRHVTIVMAGDTWSDEACQQALACGLSVNREVFMAARSKMLVHMASRRASIAPTLDLIPTADAAPGLFRLHLDESRKEDWFRDEDDFRELFDKMLAIAEGTGTRWLVIPDPVRDGRYSAALGVFFSGGVCRLQEVMTASSYRSRGFATRLLDEASRQARKAGVEVVALLANPEDPAHRLYEKLGFIDLSSQVTLMRY